MEDLVKIFPITTLKVKKKNYKISMDFLWKLKILMFLVMHYILTYLRIIVNLK